MYFIMELRVCDDENRNRKKKVKNRQSYKIPYKKKLLCIRREYGGYIIPMMRGGEKMRARYLHGPVTEQHYRYRAVKLASSSRRASERARAGSHIRHNRFRFEATRRGCRSHCHTYFSGNGAPCTIFAL